MAVGFRRRRLPADGNAEPSPSPTPNCDHRPDHRAIAVAARPDLSRCRRDCHHPRSNLSPWSLTASSCGCWLPGRIDRIDPATDSVVDSVTFGPTTDLYNGLAVNAAGLWATDSDSAAWSIESTRRPLAVAANDPGRACPEGRARQRRRSLGRGRPRRHGAAPRLGNEQDRGRRSRSARAGPSGPNWLGGRPRQHLGRLPNNAHHRPHRPVSGHGPGHHRRRRPTFTPCGGMAIADDAAWVTSCSDGTLMARVDANSNTSRRHDGPGRQRLQPDGDQRLHLGFRRWRRCRDRDAGPDQPGHEPRSIACWCPRRALAAVATSSSPPGQCGWSTATTMP